MLDQFNRNIDYLRISVTDKCNMRCRYCMPEEGVDRLDHSKILSPEHIKEIVEAFAELGITKVRITGGEPLVRNGIVEICKMVAATNGIKEVCLTTNAQLLKRYAKDLKDSGIDRLNISLDSLNPLRYEFMSHGAKIENALEGINEAKRVGFENIKINSVLIKGWNDDEFENLVQFAFKNGLKIRFIELMPIGPSKELYKESFVDNDSLVKKLSGFVFKENDGVSSIYVNPKTGQEVGFISSLSHSFCGLCSRIRLTADGMLKPCLHSPLEVGVLPLSSSCLVYDIKVHFYIVFIIIYKSI